MGYIKHHAIVVISFDEELLKKAHRKAKKIFGEQVSKVMETPVNVEFTFYIGPDGSKEGWSESDAGNAKRDEFIEWVEGQAYGDGSNSLRYSELFFGEDENKSEVTRHN